MQLLVVTAAMFAGGFILAYLWEYITAQILKISHLAEIKGFHFHHSIFGLAGFIIALYFIGSWIKFFSVISFSTGIIIQHSLTPDGFVFITRN